ncbi:preprotein translocase subunit SecE [Haliovirga abyssi]|uniref:Protein translocase subunit SecE n=1 Tax=Haliovirga abyssi TaxID=2996794 RepID=A0AAU9DD72_9FUSO|nr:preprotein translocase subunit SecE [Haliovirga abyssi]BDU51295.1 protein translocase subunit SecE [Haliovirga abyssi]
MKKFLTEVKGEFSKVSWPTVTEAKNATALVIALGVATSLYLGVFDVFFSKLLNFFIR